MADQDKSDTPQETVPEQAPESPTGSDDKQPAEAPAQTPDEGPAEPKPEPGDKPEGKPKSGRKKIVLIVLAVILVLAAIGAGSYWAFQTVTERRAAVEDLSQATQLVEDADVVVIEVDEIVRTPIEVSVGVRAEAALDMVPDAEADLEEALALIEQAEPALSEEDAIDAAALAESALARLEMLEHGAQILDANVKAAGAMEHALAGWDAIIEAEELSDQAVKEYNKLTDQAVKQSKKLAQQAQDKAEEASESFKAAEKAFPDADFSAYIAYADGKIDALALSIKADDAYLADKPTDANKFNDQYNAAEKKLVELAKSLPASPVEPIKVAYENLATEPTEEYYRARDRATASDAQLQGNDAAEE